MSEKCVWQLDVIDEMYETTCGQAYVLNDGTLEENEMKYCCFCGKELVEAYHDSLP